MTSSPRLAPLLAALALGAACNSHETERRATAAAGAPGRAVTGVATEPSADCTARVVTGDSVGHVRIGMALDVLGRMCPVVHDTTMQPNLKLPAERRVSFLMGADTVVASVGVGRVTPGRWPRRAD